MSKCYSTCVFLCSVKAWLLQLSSSLISKLFSQETSENPKQCSLGNLQVIDTWPCFSTSAGTLLASSPSANQLQTFLHRINYKHSCIDLFFFCRWYWSSVPCQHFQDLCSFSTALFLIWQDTCLFQIPSVVTKSTGQQTFAHQGPTVWSKLLHNTRLSFSLDSFKTALKMEPFHQQDLWFPPPLPIDWWWWWWWWGCWHICCGVRVWV